MRIGLVGCVKTKREHAAPARDLYVSPLFTGRRAHVERSCDRWFVLSAEHGLVDPDTVIEPYDVALAAQSSRERRQWSDRVIEQLRHRIGDLGAHAFEIHAGSPYRDFGLIAQLEAAGAAVEVPAGGLTQGEQLAFYQRGTRPPRPASTGLTQPPSPPRASGSTIPRARGRPGGKYFPLTRHLLARDQAQPTLTFAEVDAILGAPLPASSRTYREWWANTDRSPQARSWLEAGYRVDAVDLMARRVTFWRTRRAPADASSPPPPVPGRADSGLDATPVEPRPQGDRVWSLRSNPAVVVSVVEALLAHAQTLAAEGPANFAPDPEADAFLRADPFAFLVAVVFDQGIVAERAWAAPWLLRTRLGHLDPLRMVADPDAVRVAVAEPPSLHRYVENVPRWVVSAAQQVLDGYGGDAERIWNDEPTAVELRRRLEAFDGIGQKKAAMAVEILERDRGVIVRELTGSDVAFDVHIRRVFLRTGLADTDGLDHVVDQARLAHPDRPGALDLPAWDIGRNWCRPREPQCSACPLRDACPRLVDRAVGVQST